MKWCKYFIALSIFAFARLAPGSTPPDTLDLIGGLASSYTIGWYGGGWLDSAWCGDTVKRDTATIIGTRTVLDSLTDTYITLPDTQTIITPTVITCSPSNFMPFDSNGFYPGATYIDYTFKFRDSYAQLPVVWNNWKGIDSATVSPYKYLMIVYQGLLPHLQMSLSFFYGTWSDPVDSVLNASDSIKRVTNAGDGVGMLYPATDWETAIIKIPDSVNLPGVTGLIFAIGNATGGPGKTSPVGHLKIARIALLINATIPVKYQAASKNTINNRYMFTPAGGNVSVTAFSLKGEELFNRNVTVKAGMKYSIRQFMRGTLGLSASQVRLVKIKGEGVNVSTKMW